MNVYDIWHIIYDIWYTNTAFFAILLCHIKQVYMIKLCLFWFGYLHVCQISSKQTKHIDSLVNHWETPISRAAWIRFIECPVDKKGGGWLADDLPTRGSWCSNWWTGLCLSFLLSFTEGFWMNIFPGISMTSKWEAWDEGWGHCDHSNQKRYLDFCCPCQQKWLDSS